MSMKKFLNLACGDHFINSPKWTNCDFAPQSSIVEHADLSKKFPYPSNYFDLVYCSHYIEHIQIKRVTFFLDECFRTLRNGGLIRLALPDLENIVREYIKNIDSKNFEFSSFNVTELIDQCTRSNSGGELQDWYNSLKGNEKLTKYIYSRMGYKHKSQSMNYSVRNKLKKITLRKLIIKIQSKYSQFIILLLPKWFRFNHISQIATGERHYWVHDFNSIKKLLELSGFTDIEKVDANYSSEEEFECYPLDLNQQSFPRKGLESMFIEARKA